MPNTKPVQGGESAIINRRPTRIIALRHVWRRRRSREDAFLLADMLGLSDLLAPALTSKEG